MTLPGGTQLVHAIARGERFPINFGREVAAAIAGVPDRCLLNMLLRRLPRLLCRLCSVGGTWLWPVHLARFRLGACRMQVQTCLHALSLPTFCMRHHLQGGLEEVRGVEGGGGGAH